MYNEARTIHAIVERALAVVDTVLLVDDGSRDGTDVLLAEFVRSRPRVVVLPHQANLGVSEATYTGFAYAVEQWRAHRIDEQAVLITMDGDGQHVPEDIPVALALLEAGPADVVLGRRSLDNYPRFKKVGNRLLTWWASSLSRVHYSDVECGFRVMRMAVVADILPFYAATRYACCQEIAILTALRGWRIRNDWPVQVPIYRAGTRMSHGFNNAWSALRAAWRVRRGRPYRRSRLWRQALTEEAASALEPTQSQWSGMGG